MLISEKEGENLRMTEGYYLKSCTCFQTKMDICRFVKKIQKFMCDHNFFFEIENKFGWMDACGRCFCVHTSLGNILTVKN